MLSSVISPTHEFSPLSGYFSDRPEKKGRDFVLDLTKPSPDSRPSRRGLYIGFGALCGGLVAVITELLITSGSDIGPQVAQTGHHAISTGAAAGPIVLLLGLSQRRKNPDLFWFGVSYALGLTATLAI